MTSKPNTIPSSCCWRGET